MCHPVILRGSRQLNLPECPRGDVATLDGEVGVADECDAGHGEADGAELGEGDPVAVLRREDGSQDQSEETRARR